MNAPANVRLRPAGSTIESVFTVPGIRCAGCIAKIETGMTAIQGIAAVRVNFSGKKVSVSHLPELTPRDIETCFERMGFEAQQAVSNIDERDPEAKMLTRALAVAGFAAMNVMLFSVSIWAGADPATRQLFHWLSALIAVPAIAYAGRPFFLSAWRALRARRTNMDVPIAVGLVLVTAMSLHETVTHGPHAWFDGAVMLLFFLLIGRVLDKQVRARAMTGIEALLKQRAPGAHVVQGDGGTIWREAEHLAPGMRMLVAAGDRFAADGTVESGTSHVDASLLTGESEAAEARVGSDVAAGSLNLTAALTVRVTRAGEDTAIAEMARLMEAAAQGKSRYVRIADRAARLYAPVVHLVAAAAFTGWMMAGAGWHEALLIAVAVLIITCPCALGLAVPAAQVVAAGRLMKAGILVKDGSALERLAEVDQVFFDKTGTLTMGSPVPQDLGVLSDEDASVILALAQSSRQPLSRSLTRALNGMNVTPAALENLTERPGEGVFAAYRGQPVALRKPSKRDAPLATLFERDGDPLHLLTFADDLRPEARSAIDALKIRIPDIAILSGDREGPVAKVARDLDIPARSDLLPPQKLATIRAAQADGHRVFMVGDGLNDGPALSAADVSMAPGTASDAGQQAADFVFLGNSLRPVVTALDTAKRTMRIVRQNFALAIMYNILAVPLAVAGLVTPLVAAVAMSLSSVIVVGNSLRLARS
ncbi:cadmium-translocating P-type ATPase [Pacificimonas sp. WHA3]|uniref:Cadmium-translocating P-type ATPase n=1 Tax=Pacificimonas pallii TaxID=2827236 RepID=A0ABS6SHN7_9SPHN|nr:heavy metal translocating P-type ATPase [Pacificimonas pallii]MBV7257416.1 cadmium-translocating P-type ATPase [Pacificimonas pallii]